MASVTDIVNLALVPLLGCSRIQNINDDQTEAVVMNAAYIPCRDAVLEELPWSFAVGRDVWSPTADTPSWGYTYSYLIPSTVIRMLDVNIGRARFNFDWQVEGDRMLTNHSSVNVRYINKIDNTNLFSAGFVNCLAIYLAWYCAVALSENNGLKDSLWAQYQRALKEAAASDGQQGVKAKSPANALIRFR